jgi:hypothetical protein
MDYFEGIFLSQRLHLIHFIKIMHRFNKIHDKYFRLGVVRIK